MFENIPNELKLLNQWCCWKLEDVGAKRGTKIPYNPKTKRYASVDDPSTWVTFKEAVEASHSYSGIGFIFTDNDPYFFIDLDNTEGDNAALERQIRISREFNTYSEVSPSGEGLHIIGKGSVPSGRRRSFVEVYSSGRYATFTGNVHNNAPIVEYQDKLIQLWQQMGEGGPVTHTYQGNTNEKYKDEEIITQAANAVNGDKFQQLFTGQWLEVYQSQSEADFALIDIIAFYTQNRNQIGRIFRASALGKRNKANRKDYLDWMINKSFDRMLPPIDFDGFKNEVQLKLSLDTPVAQLVVPVPHKNFDPGSNPGGRTAPEPSAITLPPGIMGDIAQFIYKTSPRPVPEIALAASIGLMAGIAGRAYNVNGEGLNQYILLIAQSGTGKEAMAAGIDKLMNAIKLTVPTSTNVIGPAELTSGEAVLKHINKTSQCFVSVLSEFGYRLQSMTDKRNSAQRTLKQMLLDLYHKSGKGRIFRAKIYSDRDKNVEDTLSPSFSILAETTPSTFYDFISEEMIADGLLPRFILIEYKGIRVPLNRNAIEYPPTWLIDRLGTFVANCDTLAFNKRVIDIQIEPDAEEELNRFDLYTTQMINTNVKEDIRQLWNRAHLKAWKLAGLVAVGINMFNPVITMENLSWAMDIVHNDIKALSGKFETGEVGNKSDEIKQLVDMRRVIKDYLSKSMEEIEKYEKGKSIKLMHHEKVIPQSYISKRLMAVASFRNDRLGSTAAIKRTIQVLIDGDKIREIGKQELTTRFATTQRSFIVSDVSLLD